MSLAIHLALIILGILSLFLSLAAAILAIAQRATGDPSKPGFISLSEITGLKAALKALIETSKTERLWLVLFIAGEVLILVGALLRLPFD